MIFKAKIEFTSNTYITEYGKIKGNAAIMLSNNGYLTDITPPSTVFGKDMYFIISTVETITIEIDSSIGRIEVNIGLEV
ncbi:hypothetical protein [Clostridium beijerinckii]|uniref:CheY-specific phosphatase CheX n=1 Tax=Clostridium beijerinckii TaxID=1520 RepID=A0A9Q5GD46_CLOBE|nr:hypothetical protein [Clostridium beijerinckii]AQS07040.1 hypothetical protein CLBIJ_44900 [Clostridium beijerinckii]MBA2883536.1 CheY-specific phosphatase CheX [Clostridium beijerinckii]MBA2898723.1 CheY-specific phosphatase CheX [Clostridium beijerinckii]MBA2908123.1 CheY-specific phosphatase CheX [Clostridium beijerinckii]MBA9013329.1 CheY-specific phosphatase CheX [Clostridium beijerinckii]